MSRGKRPIIEQHRVRREGGYWMATCPSCNAAYRFQDTDLAKHHDCPLCTTRFVLCPPEARHAE